MVIAERSRDRDIEKHITQVERRVKISAVEAEDKLRRKLRNLKNGRPGVWREFFTIRQSEGGYIPPDSRDGKGHPGFSVQEEELFQTAQGVMVEEGVVWDKPYDRKTYVDKEQDSIYETKVLISRAFPGEPHLVFSLGVTVGWNSRKIVSASCEVKKLGNPQKPRRKV